MPGIRHIKSPPTACLSFSTRALAAIAVASPCGRLVH
jgi:hypothetical protein